MMARLVESITNWASCVQGTNEQQIQELIHLLDEDHPPSFAQVWSSHGIWTSIDPSSILLLVLQKCCKNLGQGLRHKGGEQDAIFDAIYDEIRLNMWPYTQILGLPKLHVLPVASNNGHQFPSLPHSFVLFFLFGLKLDVTFVNVHCHCEILTIVTMSGLGWDELPKMFFCGSSQFCAHYMSISFKLSSPLILCGQRCCTHHHLLNQVSILKIALSSRMTRFSQVALVGHLCPNNHVMKLHTKNYGSLDTNADSLFVIKPWSIGITKLALKYPHVQGS